MKAVITGGTGLVGRALLARLPGALIFTRDPRAAAQRLGDLDARQWHPETGPAPAEALIGSDAIFNLAGEPVAGRWTTERKRRIRDSRVIGTRNLVAGIAAMETKPAVLVSASAVGYYGDGGEEQLDESAAPGAGFLAEVCAAWEKEARAAEDLGVRVVCVRIGVVLAARGGALAKMLPAFKLAAGGRLGSGKQWMPWVHIDDVVGILLHVSQAEELRGAVNAVSPSPVTNAGFTLALGHALHRPAPFPVPAAALRMAFGEMSEMLLASQRAIPRAAEQCGYAFAYPDLPRALEAALAPASR